MRPESTAAQITSLKNPFLQEIRKAARTGSLTPDGYAIAESFHLLEEALRSECEVKAVLASRSVQSAVEGVVRGLRKRVIAIEDALFQSISSTESSQGVLALVRLPAWNLENLFRGRSMVVVLDGIQDPGNAGAIIRVAEAFGATGAIFGRGSAHPHHPKLLRAAAGSMFRLPYAAGVETSLVSAAFRQRRMILFTAQPSGGTTLPEADLKAKFALVVGSEGKGISDEWSSGSQPLRIPTTSVESLNAAVAAGIILYEASRQRMLA